MGTAVIQDVSDTAFMVAVYRAMETKRPDALFHDPLAAKLAGQHGEKIVAGLPHMAPFAKWLVAIRTRVIDAFIEAAVAEGVGTVLNLGAGLDTRPYRMQLPASLNWIEVDIPKIIALKESRLADETPRCRLERIKLDLADTEARRRLFADIAGKGGTVLVLTEGVIPYLASSEVAALADDLKSHGSFRYWIIDYMSPQAMEWRRRHHQKLKMHNAPFLFDPGDWLAFFSQRGWRTKDIRYIPEEADRLGRPVELPFLVLLMMKVIGLFTAKHGAAAFRKSMAYVLLES